MSRQQSTKHGMEIIGKSVTGPKHRQTNSECEDNWAKVNTKDYAIVAVGDGLGSAKSSAKGSDIATSSAATSLHDKLEESDESIAELDEKTIKNRVVGALFGARKDVCTTAKEAENPLEYYHTTLSIALVTNHWYAAVAIGDSGMVGIKNKNDYTALLEREESETANMTTPLTSERDFVKNRLRFVYEETALQAIAAFTDGLDRFVWSKEDRQRPRGEFFDQLYRFVTEVNSLTDESSKSYFNQFLDSDHFHNYSDDDKTLVVCRLSEQFNTQITGQDRTRKYHDKIFIDAVKSDGAQSTKEIHQKIGCAYSTARRRLTELEEEQVLKSKKTGQKRTWHTDDSED